MIELSEKTETLLEVIFPEESLRREASQILTNDCAENIPFCRGHDAHTMERIRFSILKLSQGNVERMTEAAELAYSDWRDLFMAAGFDENIHAHKEWYEAVTDK